MRDLVFASSFLVMLPAALRFGHVGIMLWAWVSMVAPVQYLYGFARGIPFKKVVVAVALVSLVVDRANRRKFYADTHVKIMICFLIMALLSYTMALSDKPRVDDLADRLTKVVALCLFMIMTIRNRLQIHSLMIAICMGMSIHGAIEASKFIASGGAHVLQGPGTIGDNNHFGLAILMVVPPLVYLFQYTVSPLVRTVLGMAIASNIVGVVATNSRGALVGLIAMGFAMFMRSRNKARTLVILVILGGIGAAVAPERWYGRMSTISNAEEDGSFMSRVGSWKMNTLLALDRPLTGGGFSAMEDTSIFLRYLPSFGSLDFIPTKTPTITFAAHSIYFQVLGDQGFIGLGLFLCLLYLAFRNIRIIRRLSEGRADLKWASDLGNMLRFTLIAYMVAGAALSMAYFEFYYLVITLISTTRRHVEEVVGKPVPAGLAALQSTGRPTFGAVPDMARRLPAGIGQQNR
jgi:probable O-glycosylation ligase (exosortase A-associated)